MLAICLSALACTACDAMQPSARYELREIVHELSAELCEPDSYYVKCFCIARPCGVLWCRDRVPKKVRLCAQYMRDRGDLGANNAERRAMLLECVASTHVQGYGLFASDTPACNDFTQWPQLPEYAPREKAARRDVPATRASNDTPVTARSRPPEALAPAWSDPLGIPEHPRSSVE